MAKLTVLDMVQDILNDMDSDEVNSFTDTIEAEQVAQILQTTYFELIGTRNWPHLKGLLSLDNTASVTRPTHMRLPEDLKELTFIKYNKQTSDDPTRRRYEEVKYLFPDEFLFKTNQRDNTVANVDVITDLTGVEFLVFNDIHPTYWTSFDDENIIFDSYDTEFGTTLTKGNSQAFGVREPVWSHIDTFIPDLPMEAFPSFLAEAKSVCFFVLKQMSNAKAEQQATRGARRMSRKAWAARGGVRYPDFGRRGKGRTSSTTRQPLDKTQVTPAP